MKPYMEKLADRKILSYFISIGVLGLVLENVLLFSLVDLLNFDILLSKLIGVEASVAAMFALNDRFTFRPEQNYLPKRFLKSHIVRSGGIIISIVILQVGVELGVWYLLANTIGIGAGFIFNYVMESFYTWNRLHS